MGRYTGYYYDGYVEDLVSHMGYEQKTNKETSSDPN